MIRYLSACTACYRNPYNEQCKVAGRQISDHEFGTYFFLAPTPVGFFAVSTSLIGMGRRSIHESEKAGLDILTSGIVFSKEFFMNGRREKNNLIVFFAAFGVVILPFYPHQGVANDWCYLQVSVKNHKRNGNENLVRGGAYKRVSVTVVKRSKCRGVKICTMPGEIKQCNVGSHCQVFKTQQHWFIVLKHMGRKKRSEVQGVQYSTHREGNRRAPRCGHS